MQTRLWVNPQLEPDRESVIGTLKRQPEELSGPPEPVAKSVGVDVQPVGRGSDVAHRVHP